jgi:hypothetical protein
VLKTNISQYTKHVQTVLLVSSNYSGDIEGIAQHMHTRTQSSLDKVNLPVQQVPFKHLTVYEVVAGVLRNEVALPHRDDDHDL